MIHKVRVILETEQDVFRDLEVDTNQYLTALHEGIKAAFDLEGSEMASFYLSNDQWFQGSEIPLLKLSETLGDEDEEVETMSEIKIGSVIPDKGNKMIYVYDFFSLWTFYVEVVETDVISVNDNFPAVVFSYGKRPAEPPENDMFGELNLDFDLDDDDEFSDFEDGYDDDELW